MSKEAFGQWLNEVTADTKKETRERVRGNLTNVLGFLEQLARLSSPVSVAADKVLKPEDTEGVSYFFQAMLGTEEPVRDPLTVRVGKTLEINAEGGAARYRLSLTLEAKEPAGAVFHMTPSRGLISLDLNGSPRINREDPTDPINILARHQIGKARLVAAIVRRVCFAREDERDLWRFNTSASSNRNAERTRAFPNNPLKPEISPN